METPRTRSIPALWPFKRIFYGWGIVGVSVLVSFAQVPMYGPVLSVFVNPIHEDMGWSHFEISAAFTVGSLFGSLLSSIVGGQLDRYGARAAVVVAGMIVTGALVGLAVMQEVWQFWGLFGVGRTAALVGINLGTSVAVGNWFVRKRGRAISFLGIGLRSGQALMPVVLITPIIIAYSWRHAYMVLAVVTFVLIVVPAWLFIRRRPEDFGLLPDGDAPDVATTATGDSRPVVQDVEESFTLQEARKTMAFWLITIAVMMVVFAQTSVNLHAVASVIDRGVSESLSGAFVFIIMGTAALSAYGWGALMDRIHVRWVTAVATIFSGAAMVVIIFADNLPLAVTFAVLFGLGTGGWTLAQTLLFANYFGRRHLGAIRGLSQVLSGPLGAAGPFLAGGIRTYTGSYELSFIIFFAALVVVFLALVLARPPRRRQPSAG